MINRILCLFSGLFAAVCLQAQTLNLDSCYMRAETNYPLVQQYELIEKTKDYSIANANKAYLPQIGIYGQATYQSDVTALPFDFSQIPIAGLSEIVIPQISKDQYKAYGEISYSLTGLITNKNNNDLIKANAEVETQKVKVDLYMLRERIHSLYFGILLIDAQIEQVELVQDDIQNGIARTETAIQNGVALKSAADNLRAELLKTKQQTTELQATRKGYLSMLALFIGKEIGENAVLEKPLTPTLSNQILRPELRLFEAQNSAFDLQNRKITNKNLPHLNFFFQGGIGKPALNIFNESLDPYYITGLRLSWNISGFYVMKNERRQIAENQHNIQIQRETFLFNTLLTLNRQQEEIDKMQNLLVDDDEIILLFEKVKKSAQTQLDNGTATTNDYLTAINNESRARKNRALHEIQLLMYQYSANITTGN